MLAEKEAGASGHMSSLAANSSAWASRALANNGQLLLADEPTGQLDSQTARQIMGLIRSIVHAEGLTAIATTHDRGLMDIADRVLMIQNGQVQAG